VELIVRIGTDPASWAVISPSYGDLVQQLSQATEPVVLSVTAPLDGQLVLSHRAAGSVAVIQPPGGRVWQTHDWNPGHGSAPSAPNLYLPSPAGPGQGSLYAVSSNVNDSTAVADITAAMKDEKVLTFQVYDASGEGTLMIQGATLAFAVVC
jgi:hypothetical protein